EGAADESALERDEAGLLARRTRLERRVVLRHDRNGGGGRERPHLGDDGAGAAGAQLLGERVRADERDVDAGRIQLDLTRELDELGRRLVRRDHDDGVRIALLDPKQPTFDPTAVALYLALPATLT